MSESTQRRPYGQLASDSYLLTFDSTSDTERKARKVAQQLASQRKLKGALISMLAAIGDVQEECGKNIDFSEFTSRFVRGFMSGSPVEVAPRITALTTPDALPDGWVGTVDHVDPDVVRYTLQLKMGNVLDEDD